MNQIYLVKRFALLFVMFITSVAWAQERTVTGRVTSAEDGSALPGVSVVIKGTTFGTATDVNGSYTLSVPTDATLVFTFIGMRTEEISVGQRTQVNVALEVDVMQLNEVVITTFGEAKKSSFTGSYSQINSENIAVRPLSNVVAAIAGTTAGVTTTAGTGQPGVAPDVRIRGFGSINASNSPLYVVDGVPYNESIANLNPADIESMTILKDAASTSLYGARAANGVVMITTKKGKDKDGSINLRYTKGFSTRGMPEYDKVGASQYYPLMWEMLRNNLAYGVAGQDLATAGANATATLGANVRYNVYDVPFNQLVDATGAMNPNARLLYSESDLDWEAPIMRQGNRDELNLNFSGASDKSDYYVSFGYLNDKGYQIRSDYNRYNARINYNTQLKSWFKTGGNIAATITESRQSAADGGTSFVNPFFFSRGMGPIFPVYAHDPLNPGTFLLRDGQKFYDFGNMSALGLPNRPQYGGRHAIAETEWNEDFYRRNVLNTRGYMEISFLKDFRFTTNVGLDIANQNDVTFGNPDVGDGAPAGRTTHAFDNVTNFNLNQLLNYSKSFDSHNISALVGHESYNRRTNFVSVSKSQQSLEGNIELPNFATLTGGSGYLDRYRVEGYFSRLNYDFNEKYFASVSVRRDGSSKFSQDVRWGTFMSVSGAWRLDQEIFIQNIPAISQLKLRASYGQTGNDGGAGTSISYYAWQPVYGLGWDNALEPGILQGSLGNRNLSWESSDASDVALEFGLLKNRITGTIEYFNRASSNLLFAVPMPLSSGVATVTRNIGTMVNRGMEVSISAEVLKMGDFSWQLDVNATKLKNEITKMPDESEEIISGTKKLKEGRSLYDFWLREYIGINPANGDVLYRADTWNPANSFVNEAGDTVTNSISNARYHYNGSSIPKISGGFTNTFRYKNFSLSAVVVYQIGGKVYDGAYASLMGSGGFGSAKHVDILNRWRNPGDITNVPRMDDGRTADYNGTSDRWLINASYLNIRSVTLAYNLPTAWANKLFLSRAQFYVSGENLLMKSKRSGMNVQESYAGTTSNVYSPAKSLVFGASITL
ncbi:MAG TPA: SusC/RagA family TonB-linked outer membrane protein [Cyclobacteriaceae bacterium]|jgi:TonB-linked SusC/RagA family outer membrane protein|nr:SusC/RagA family TonB-linked outer membrane protein [Cyclobacteriaceae bacterium]HRF33086.1 SusC/RagA family TonB-linked outer membrane protein [Cyclobacteriaceae bacterium]